MIDQRFFDRKDLKIDPVRISIGSSTNGLSVWKKQLPNSQPFTVFDGRSVLRFVLEFQTHRFEFKIFHHKKLYHLHAWSTIPKNLPSSRYQSTLQKTLSDRRLRALAPKAIRDEFEPQITFLFTWSSKLNENVN